MSKNYLDSLYALTGQVAVITGGTGTLCGEMAEALALAGVEVVLVGTQAAKAEPRLARIQAANGKGYFVKADVTSRPEIEGLLKTVLERSGRVDILINGAGVNAFSPFFEIGDEEFDRVMNVNFRAVFRCCQIFGKYLVERGQGGSVINIGSMSGLNPLSRVFTYSASKAALHNLSKNLAREWGPHKVRVNILVPGFFPAEQNRKALTPERLALIKGHTPMGRLGDAHELTGATLLLASSAAGSFITGTELVVDGGFDSMTI
jgi:NAD(P)-dependent dehydrogenase (short-subunit alcohol dehydrogenase family)